MLTITLTLTTCLLTKKDLRRRRIFGETQKNEGSDDASWQTPAITKHEKGKGGLSDAHKVSRELSFESSRYTTVQLVQSVHNDKSRWDSSRFVRTGSLREDDSSTVMDSTDSLDIFRIQSAFSCGMVSLPNLFWLARCCRGKKIRSASLTKSNGTICAYERILLLLVFVCGSDKQQDTRQ